MSNEIATYSMILSKLSLGKSGAECPTKTQILAINSLIIIDNASTYGANECVKIDDIRKGDDVSSYGEWTISVSASPTSVSSSGGTSTITASAKRTVYWASGDVTEETGNPTLSTNLGSLSSSSSPSTLTLGENTSTSSRTATIKATHGGKSATCTVTQTGYTPPVDTYVFTWEDGSTSDINASFLWDFSANGTAANIPVVSTKNGSSQSWSVSSKPSWIATSTTSSKVTISASDNSGSARNGTIVLTQSGSNKTLRINVTQDAKPAEDEYTFEIRKSDEEYTGKTSITFDVPASTVGWSGNYAYRSRKNGEQFANVSFSSSASWIHVESSGAYTVHHNTGSSSRSGTITLTQAESGLKCYIYINQSGYTPTYTFNVSPTNLSVTAAETNETLTVQSYKTVLESDGSETTQSLDYEFSSNNSWVAAARTTINTTYITVAENKTITQRTAKITLTQAESGAQAFTNVIQAGKAEVVNKLTLNSLTYDSCYLFLLGTEPVKSNSQDYFMFTANSSMNWYTSLGIKVNGGTAYAGNLVNIYVYSSGSYKLVKSFQLQLGEQTVTY